MDISYHNTEYSARIIFFDVDDVTVAKYFLKDNSASDIIDMLELHGFPPNDAIRTVLSEEYFEDDDSYDHDDGEL
jgi:hypothetical protein